LIESDGKTFIVMELIEGKTLHALLAEGPLQATEAIPIALQIIEALAEAHRAGILHRDVKSGNIVVTPRGQVKVLDFGLAKRLGPETGSGDSVPEALTREGTTLGTLSYMSPEQLLGKALDRRSDLFSASSSSKWSRTAAIRSYPIAVSDAICTLPARLRRCPRRKAEVDHPEAPREGRTSVRERGRGSRRAGGLEAR
jgi:serine/threonine-protein kinase